MDRIEKVLDSSRTQKTQMTYQSNIAKRKPILPPQPTNKYDVYYSVKQQQEKVNAVTKRLSSPRI